MVEARITSKGQVRDQLGLEPGDKLDFTVDGGRLEVRPKRRRSILEFRGLFRSKPVDASWAEQREAAWNDMTKRLVPGAQDRSGSSSTRTLSCGC